jgi:hypothetical protein
MIVADECDKLVFSSGGFEEYRTAKFIRQDRKRS